MAAGVPLDLGDTQFSLVQCSQCGVQFKWPPIPRDALNKCYEAASSDNWGADPNPTSRQFDLIRSIAERHANGLNILDIGCFNGAMLKYFGPAWTTFGIEPSHAAAQMASSRGVKVLGPALENVRGSQQQFDVVTAIDVIEHLINPTSFFGAIDDVLKVNGVLILLTADTGSWAWRLEKNKYWYCSLPEHTCFWSRQSIAHLCGINRWKIVHWERLRHQKSPLGQIVVEAGRNLAYVFGDRLRGLGIPKLQHMLDRSAPVWITARDHFICAIVRE